MLLRLVCLPTQVLCGQLLSALRHYMPLRSSRRLQRLPDLQTRVLTERFNEETHCNRLLTSIGTETAYITGPSVDQFISRDNTIVFPFHPTQDLSGFMLVLTSRLEVIREGSPTCLPIGGYLRDVCVYLSYVCSLDRYFTTLNVCSTIQQIPVVSYLTLVHGQYTNIETEISGWVVHLAPIRRTVRIKSPDPDISVSST